ncbi:MAG: hypothetical protein KAH32_07780, partial [Chlamydiia bacterium]|nr:hypothetical protein [Chlamydiia bacterium]
MGKSCGITTEAFLDSYEIGTMIADGDAVEGLKSTIENFIDTKLEELGDVPGSRSLIMNGLITSMTKLSESGDLNPNQSLTGASIATSYMSAKPEPADPSSDNDNDNTVDDIVVNEVASMSTNIESTVIPEGTKVKDYPPFIESSVKKVSMRVFYNLYFKGRGKFVKGFTAFTNSHVREILMGTTLGEDENISGISGPTADMSAQFNVLKEKLRIASDGVANKTKEEIQQKFDENDQDFINSYYAYVMLANLEFMIENIAEGNTVSRDKDARNAKEKDKKYINPAPKVTIKKAFETSFKLFSNENLDELPFNLEESTLEEKKLFVERMTVTDTVKDGDSIVEYSPFVRFEGVPVGYSTKRFNVDYPGLLMEDDSSKINSIKKGDIFMSKVDPETGKRLLVRATPEYIITYNLADKAKSGHEEDFNGFDNDVSFIKFLLKSTTRLLAPNENGVFTQDPNKPFLSDVDFYKISTELSNIEDRTYDGIKKFLKKKVREGANSDDSVNVIYRSIYQAYFADGNDKIYSYFPAGRKTAVKLVSLGEASKLKKFQFASKTGAPNMISALVQFLSKQSSGRLYYKDGELVEFSVAETASIEIGLPDNILNSVISDGKLTKGVKENIYATVKGNTVEVTIDYGDDNEESLTVNVYKDSHNNIKYVPSRKITDHDEIARVFKSLNLPPKLQDTEFIAKLVSATTVSNEENNTISGKRISDVIGAVASMAVIKDSEFGKEINDTGNKKLI